MKTKRPALQLRDTVQLASHKSVIPAFDSCDGAGVKPFVGHDAKLTVSSITGTGSKRNPFAVVVTDGNYFWHLEPDDVVKVA
jgi:hypothetical protein